MPKQREIVTPLRTITIMGKRVVYRIELDQAELCWMAERAIRNHGQVSKDGPCIVTIVEREP
jgi:hypothetical protein